jgi:hypothetical protein
MERKGDPGFTFLYLVHPGDSFLAFPDGLEYYFF